jgi:hypothetical protein
MTEHTTRRQTRFFTADAPPDAAKATGWFYRAREGTFGPFASKEEAREHLEQNLQGEGGRRSGLFQRLMEVLKPGVDSERTEGRRRDDRAPGSSLDGADPRETDLFDRPARLMQPMVADNLKRLPNNRTVDVTVPDDGVGLRVYLASHRFLLRVTRNHIQLEDDSGRVHLLYEGTSSVGRHTENDLVVDPGYTEVSRFHLLIDWDGGDVVSLTDTSTLGTFVEPRALS